MAMPWEEDWSAQTSAAPAAMPWEEDWSSVAPKIESNDAKPATSDYLKSTTAGVLSGAGMIPQGAAELLTRGVNAVAGTELRAENPFKGAIEWLNESQSPAAKREVAKTQISGSLFDPETWSFGADPSVRGLALQGLNAIGQFAPNLAIAIGTAGASIPAQLAIGATVGGLQALGGGAEDERTRFQAMSAAELQATSGLYRELVGKGVSHQAAKEAVAEAAALGGGLGNALPSAAEGAFENFLIGALTKGRIRLPGKGLVTKVATGALGGGAMGGTEEALEQMGQNIGSNLAVGGSRPVTADTLQQFVMGALAEGAAGTGAGALQHIALPERGTEDQKTARAIQTIAAAPDVDTAIAAASAAAAEPVFEPAPPIAGLAEAGGVWPLKLEPRGLIESAQGETAIFESVKEGERMAGVDDPQRRADVLRAVQETVAGQQRQAAINRETGGEADMDRQRQENAAAAVRRSQMANQRFADQEAQAAEKARTEAIAPLAQADAENRAQAIAKQIIDHDARGLTTATAQAYRAGLVRRIEELGFEAPKQEVAAAAAIQTRKNPEDRGDTRVVDAPTPATSEPGEAGTAPGRGVALPDTTPKPQIGGERPTEGSERPDLGRTGQQEQRPAEASKAPKAEPAAVSEASEIVWSRSGDGVSLEVTNRDGEEVGPEDIIPLSDMARWIGPKHAATIKATITQGDKSGFLSSKTEWKSWEDLPAIVRVERLPGITPEGVEYKPIPGEIGSYPAATEPANAGPIAKVAVVDRPATIAKMIVRGQPTKEPPPQKRERIAAEKVPVKVFGKTLDRLTAKELAVAAKKGKTEEVRAAATAETERRQVEYADAPVYDDQAKAISAAQKLSKVGAKQKAIPHPLKSGKWTVEPVEKREPTEKEKAAREAASAKWKREAAARKKIDVDKDSLVPAIIKLGGLKVSERAEILRDTKGNVGIPGVGFLFTKNGVAIDDMVTRLDEMGFMLPAEIADTDGGVQALRDKVEEEFSGGRQHWSLNGEGESLARAERDQQEDERQRDMAKEAQAEAEKLGAEIDLTVTPEELTEDGDAATGESLARQELTERLQQVDPDALERLAMEFADQPDDAFMAAVVAKLKEREDANLRPDEADGEAGAAQVPAEEVVRPAPETLNKVEQKGAEVNRPALPEAERFAIGKSLTKEQRKAVLATLVDVYKAKGAEKVSKGLDRDGNDIIGYAYSPDLFEKSDITGAMVRYHVTLPDGSLAHPTELFPGYTQSHIDAALAEQREKIRREKSEVERYEKLATDSAESQNAYWQKRSDDSLAQHGQWRTIAPPSERTMLEKGGRFMALFNHQKDTIAAAEEEGWKRVERPAISLESQTPASIRQKEKQAETGKVEEQTAAVRDRDVSILSAPEGTAPPAELKPQPTQQQGLFGAAAALRQAADAIDKSVRPESQAQSDLAPKELGNSSAAGDLPTNTVQPVSGKETEQKGGTSGPKPAFSLSQNGVKVDVNDLSRGVLSRMDMRLKSLGYDSRGSDDVRTMLNTRIAPDGVITHPDWIAAYEAAIAGAQRTRERLDAKAAERGKATNVDFARMRELGLTEDWREAGYITPRGSLIDLSGKREGGERGTRALDHREAGGTVGMQEYMALGNIRIDANSKSMDISREPSQEQYKRIAEFVDNSNGEITLDVENGLGELRGEYYWKPERTFSREYPADTKPARVIADIRRFFSGEEPLPLPQPRFSRQSENIERYVFQTVKDKNGMPVFGNAEVVLGRANPAKVIARGEGVNTYQWKIFDRTKPGEHGDKYLRVGELHADLTPDGTFEALRNITIYQRFRQKGNGYGENVVASMLATNTGKATPMRVINILHDTGSKEFDAIHFWQKMGVRLHNLSNDPNVEIDGDVSLGAYLRARRERSKVSLDESIQERGEGTQAQDASSGSESSRRADENSADAGTASGTGRAGILGRSDAETGGRQALTSRGPQSGQGTQGVFTTDEANREATDALQSNLRRQGHQFTITPVSLPVDRSADAEGRGDNAGTSPSDSFRLAERLAGVFGKRVVWMRADGPKRINGVVIAGADLAKEIFIDVRAGVPAHAIVGHELSHHMEADAPAVYRNLQRAIAGLLRNHAEYRQKYGIGQEYADDYISKEMIGDLLGDNFTKREFWSRVAKESGGTFRQIANTIKAWLDNLIGRLRGFGSDRFVTDVHAARKALAQAVVEYAKGRNEAVLPEWVRMSRAAVEGDGLAPAKQARDQTASAAFKANNEGISFGHYSPSEQQVATLRDIEPRVQKGFNAYLADLLDNNEAEIAEAMADKSLRLDYLNEYLDRELSISVRDDGRITIDYLPTSEVRRAVGDLPIVVFHHTASGALKHIKKEGLRPQAKRGKGTNYSSGAGVYVTLRQSGVDVDGYGRNAVRRYGGKPIAVEIEARLRDLEQDPDDADIQSGAYQYILPSVEPSEIINSSAAKNPSSSAPLFSRSEQAMGAVQGGREGHRASWDAPEPGKLDTFIRVLQDKHIDSKRVVTAIKNATGAMRDATDVYLQEELFHGRSAKAVAEFLDMELRPLFTEMVARKVEMPEFEEYLHARHAEERNQQIAKINPEMPDGGSGMDTADARAYLEALDPAKKRAYEALAKRVDAINAKTRQDTIAYGLESPDTIRAWEAAYQNYVPLHREDMEGGPGIGQGYSVKGPASRRATGSKRAVVDILANVAMQRERVVVRGEKNRVSNALVGLAIENPNQDFWKVDKPPILKVVNDRTGLVEERVDPMFKSRENVIVARIPGADGNVVEHAVIFNERDERAMRMVTALKNLDAQDLGEVLGLSAKITRYFSSINTQYNPVFGVVNLIRDTQGALFNLSTTDIRGKQADVLKHTISALRGIYIDARAARSGVQPTSAWSELWEEFQREGGRTGYRDMFRTSKDRAEAIEREIKRVSEGKAKQFGRAVFDWLSDYNDSMENAVRLAAYKVGKENGMTNQRAASMAKNLTVNFNRKGQIGVQTGALYAFFNASVQGTARMLETLNGPSGRKIIAGGFMLGSMQALLLAAAGFDDNEPPEFVRERSLILPIGDKKYLTLPMPLGLHILPNLGRIPTEFVLGGFKHPQKKIASLVNVFVEAFNPIGNAGLSLQTIAPTAIDPIAALAENKDWTGKPIAREDFNKLAPTPGHTRAKDTASAFSKAVSQALNWVSGGTNYKPGIFSPTPDQIDYLIGQVAGGLGREAMKTEQTVTSAITGEEMPTYKIPLIGRFYGSSEGQAQQGSAFYSNLREINEHEAEIKGRRKAGEPIGDYLIANPEARLVRYANHVERQVSLLRRQKRELTARGADRAQIKTIDARITQLMRVFNERVRSVTEKEAA